jgi:hypothetical protein
MNVLLNLHETADVLQSHRSDVVEHGKAEDASTWRTQECVRYTSGGPQAHGQQSVNGTDSLTVAAR